MTRKLRHLLAAGVALAALAVLVPAPAGAAQAPIAGTVAAWGCGNGNDYGQCKVPNGLAGVTAISAGYAHSLALKSNGTVVAWGCGSGADYGQCKVPGGLTGVTAISAGLYDSVALKSDGTVVAWGCGNDGGNFGQCAVPEGLDHVIAIAAGAMHTLALRDDHTVVAWGCGVDYGQCKVPEDLSGVTAIAAGDVHSLALRSDGTVVAWGCEGADDGQCTVPDGLSGVHSIAAGRFHSLAESNTGVVAWGCGEIDWGQCTVPTGLKRVNMLAGGDYQSLAVTGTVIAWGCGILGALGDAGECNVPAGLTNVIAASAGTFHSLALVAAVPKITSFSPASGPVGTPVTITGQNFLGATDVTIGGVSAGVPQVISSTQLKATVPAGAFHAPVEVTTANGSAFSSAVFKVTPKVTGFTPSARVDDLVTITGTGLYPVLLTVTFGTAVDTTASSNLAGTEITAHVPAGARTGKITVATLDGSFATPGNFGVRPTIDSVVQTGALVTVSGLTFDHVTAVRFSGPTAPVTAAFHVVNSTTLTTTVPAGAVSGPIGVTNAGGTTTSDASFAVAPRVVSFSPAKAAVGGAVAIAGSGFDATSVVRFGGVAATQVQFVSATLVKAIVPAGASSGAITVTTFLGGTAASTGAFVVTPRITGFDTPVQAGDTVDVDGTNLDGATSLKLGVTALTVIPDTPGHLTFVVPDAAVTGKLAITTSSGSFTTAGSLGVRPRIDSLSTGEAAAGSPLTILGKTFAGVTSVAFTGRSGVGAVSVSFHPVPGGLAVTVPSGAITGPVRIRNAGGSTDSAPLTVDPKVASFSPSGGHAGTTLVTINGSGFQANATVSFGGVAATSVTRLSATQLRATVPLGAVDGPLTIGNPTDATEAVSAHSFDVS